MFQFFLLVSFLFSCSFLESSHIDPLITAKRHLPKRIGFSDKKKNDAKKIQHLIVIMQENWSFDGLYGKFPHVRGLNDVDLTHVVQVDLAGKAYPNLVTCINTNTGLPYPQIPKNLPNAPFNLEAFIPMTEVTGDNTHDFYLEQFQINDGKMNRFAAYSKGGGFVMSFYDIANTEMGKISKQYVICDNWFHSCYGASMCGALWLFTAQMPLWPNASSNIVAKLSPGGALLADGLVSPEGFAIADAQPFYEPFAPGTPESLRVPPQTYLTIGDLLSNQGISWKWYAQGWNQATTTNNNPDFQYHHQAPVYFTQFAPGTQARAEHLFDLDQFYVDLTNNQVPAVSFIRSLGSVSEHPHEGSLLEGLNWASDLIKTIQASPVWESCAIIVTYDENGGRWDHVSPPIVDQFGPGTRVPTIIISPFAKRNYVDHTSYETVSILKFIEERWNLPPLSTRDAQANNILNAFHF